MLGEVLSRLISIYRMMISPLMPQSCRFDPSCSVYGIEAIKKFGGFKGSWLTLKRILRCHPFGGCGDDPVPDSFHWFKNSTHMDIKLKKRTQ